MRDPTFESACTAEYRRIKRRTGCKTCSKRRDYKAWGKYFCKLGRENKDNDCRDWQYDVGLDDNYEF